MDRNVNNGVNNNIFDITNLDLYYGIKTSRKDNVSHAHIDVDFCRPDCKNNKMICHPELVSGSYRTALPHKTVQSERRSDLLIRQNILPHKTVQSDTHSLFQDSKRPSNIISAAEYLREKRLRERNIAVLKQQTKKNKPSKLAIASMAIALSMFMTPAIADEPIPTLDKLHQDGIINPSTMDKDDDGNPIEGTGEVYPESAYNLTPAEQPGDNTITLYEKTEVIKYYDPTTGEEVAEADRLPDVEYKEITTIETTPKYYTVTLKQTEYGEGDGAKYFKWDTSSGSLKLTEVTDLLEAQITAKYDTSKENTRITNTTDNTTTTVINGGSFVGSSSDTQGGAIYNSGTDAKLGDINADFIGNYASFFSSSSSSYYASSQGGAIFNPNGTIGDITGDFVGNYASSSSYYASSQGGAIFNLKGTIGDITGDFIGNYASSTGLGSFSYGGAIFNGVYGDGGVSDSIFKIATVNGNFIGNYVSSDGKASGGAIFNGFSSSINNSKNVYFIIDDIISDFIGNYVSGDGEATGGAIYNHTNSYSSTAEIGDITGDFIGNYAYSSSGNAYGGAIYNDEKYSDGFAEIGNITGDFIGNYVFAGSGYEGSSGGAIYNKKGTIGDIKGNFIGNYASSQGGAIYNIGTIGNITGDFIGNYVISKGRFAAYGGAIYNNNGTIGNITGDFIGNYASSTRSYTYGGAISNSTFITSTEIGNITGDFIGNYVQGAAEALGGAIYNNAEGTDSTAIIGSKDEEGNVVGGLINSSFINNHASASGENASALGGAIYTNQSLNIIARDGGQSVFSGNYTEANGEKTPNAIYVRSDVVPGDLVETLVSLDAEKIVYQQKNENFDSPDIPTLTLNAQTNGTIVFNDQISGEGENFQNTTFSVDLAMAETFPPELGISKEQMYQMLELKADATVSEFVDAYIEKMIEQTPPEQRPTDEEIEQAKSEIFGEFIQVGIIVTSNTEIISTETKGGYNVKITGDNTGKVVLNNDVINANISLDNTNLYLGRENVFDKSQSLTLNSGSIYLNNNAIGTMHVPSLSLNGNTNISVDANLAKESMDRITADKYTITNDAKLNVNNIILLSDATKDVTNIRFADKELANNVAYTGVSPIAYSPIYKYSVSYGTNEEGLGMFTFIRGGGAPSNSFEAFNPAVVAPTVATQAGAYTTQVQTFNYAFQHADTFMNIPYLERVAIINANKYALSPTADATDVGNFSPLLTKQHDPGFWVKPYASFESIPLDNGPKVSNINYGTLVGYDSPITSISNGWERVITGYVGYNGASQRYQGVDNYQNGGILGGTTTFYKGNFFNATTLSVGATVGDTTTMYGSENYTMLLAGIGNKTGYNFEFKEGKYIIQPAMLISYTFVNTFDYTNAAGLRIESDPLHALQLAPGVKFIMNTKNGWQPYIGVNMVWNLLDDSKVTANDVRLPEMSIKPYVQYGIGVQKRFNDTFMAYGQAMIHNGGRNGISFSAGLRWKVGRKEK